MVLYILFPGILYWYCSSLWGFTQLSRPLIWVPGRANKSRAEPPSYATMRARKPANGPYARLYKYKNFPSRKGAKAPKYLFSKIRGWEKNTRPYEEKRNALAQGPLVRVLTVWAHNGNAVYPLCNFLVPLFAFLTSLNSERMRKLFYGLAHGWVGVWREATPVQYKDKFS